MSSRIMGLLACAVFAVSLAGCSGGEESIEDLCIDACANEASAKCEGYDKAACEKNCKNPDDVTKAIRENCESEARDAYKCRAGAKMTCGDQGPDVGNACDAQANKVMECLVKAGGGE